MCQGRTGDRCEYSCEDGFRPFGDHICGAGGQFSGGSCRPADLCVDDPAWRDAAGNGCAAQADSGCPASLLGMDTRPAADACPVICSTCSCRDDVDQDPGPGGISCSVVSDQGLCSADASVTGAADLAGAPLWTFCCSSCRGCDGVANSGASEDECGVCGGDGSSCAGCDGTANSGVVEDACGVCGGDGTSCTFETACTPTAGGIVPVGLWLLTSDGSNLAVCLPGDVEPPVAAPCEQDSCEHHLGCTLCDNWIPTITVRNPDGQGVPVQLNLDCGKPGGDTPLAASALCRMMDRLIGDATADCSRSVLHD
eukprot:SAG22_NODE_774_length_7293_cov_15.888796_2_plen_311_part_00